VAAFTSFGLGVLPSKAALRILWIRRRQLPGSPACEAPESLAAKQLQTLLSPRDCRLLAGSPLR